MVIEIIEFNNEMKSVGYIILCINHWKYFSL